MKALFTSKNLIGDGLQTSRALNRWHETHPEAQIFLHTERNHVTCIYEHMGVPMTVLTNEEEVSACGPYDFEHKFDPSAALVVCDKKYREWRRAQTDPRIPHPGYIKGAHIAEAYAELLGVELPELPGFGHLKPIFIRTPEEIPEKDRRKVLVSMFSASCTSREGKPPNKMLPWEKWQPILRFLWKRFGDDQVRFLGAPSDRAPAFLKIPENDYWTGIPLNRLANLMAASLFILTLDNGMSHLAASQEMRQVLLYPACLGKHFIIPYGNPNLWVMQMEPILVQPGSIVKDGLQRFVEAFRI